MKDAIDAGRGVRVTLWNMTAKQEGFWNCLAIYPSHDGRYFLSVQAKPATLCMQPATLYDDRHFVNNLKNQIQKPGQLYRSTQN